MKILILSLIASVCSIFVLNSNVESADYISWLKRTDISIEAADDVDPTWSIETVQPIYQTPGSLRNTWFFQGRAAYRDSDEPQVRKSL